MSQHFQQKQLAWSEYKQFFDKQHNLGKNLDIKFLERFRVLPKSCSLEEEEKFLLAKIFRTYLENSYVFIFIS